MSAAPTGSLELVARVRERPILFSAPMVRALLDGTKTQTRRALSPQPVLAVMDAESASALRAAQGVGLVPQSEAPRWRWRGTFYMPWPHCLRNESPYGAPGDQLWCRETWCAPDPMSRRIVVYRADLDEAQLDDERLARRDMGCDTHAPWRPSIFMPRWASRILLELTDVRVERVQDISDADAIAEGIERHDDDGVTYYGPLNHGDCRPVQAYAALWDSINGKRPGCAWADSPWVWCVSFRRIEP